MTFLAILFFADTLSDIWEESLDELRRTIRVGSSQLSNLIG